MASLMKSAGGGGGGGGRRRRAWLGFDDETARELW